MNKTIKKIITSDEFEKELRKISKSWTFIKNFSEQFFNEFGNTFGDFLFVNKDAEFITDCVDTWLICIDTIE